MKELGTEDESTVVGFHTWYRPQGVTYLSLRLAALARELGHEVSLLSFEHLSRGVDDEWDEKVFGLYGRPFADWVSSCTHVIWPEFVKPFEVAVARRAGAKCILIPMWEKLTREEDLGLYDHVVCPHRACQEWLDSCWPCKLTRTRYVPFDIGLGPVATHSPLRAGGRLRLFFPAAGPQPRRQGFVLLTVLEKLLEKHAHLDLTICYLRSWPAESRQLLNSLQKKFQHTTRVRVMHDLPRSAYLYLYTQHDLTLWPTVCEGLGLIGLESLSQGTPVFGMDVAPMNEYLTWGDDSWLVPCAKELSPTGVTMARELDAAVLEKELEWLLCEQEVLLESIHYGASRRARFPRADIALACRSGWKAVLGDDEDTE